MVGEWVLSESGVGSGDTDPTEKAFPWAIAILVVIVALAAIATLGHEACFENLCRVAQLDEGQALVALDELLNRQLLQEVLR